MSLLDQAAPADITFAACNNLKKNADNSPAHL